MKLEQRARELVQLIISNVQQIVLNYLMLLNIYISPYYESSPLPVISDSNHNGD
jgi:hypothetical protein